ncbi:MAG: NAD(P)-binding protein [Solirubrobacterales bacterium]|nr:NAD(P)-binding protein [Solirubrobacterales bacterium]
MTIETDYLIIGAGASGLAFADSLVAEADVEVTVIDRQDAPGGHWLHAYPFLRLHSPSAYYGVNSLPLGENRIDESGDNAGYYERATGEEVFDYFGEVASRLDRTGRVRILTAHEHLGGGPGGERVHDLRSGKVHEISPRRKVVDARYLESSVPATHTRPFGVESGANVVPVNDLPDAAGDATSYVVLGAGKTSADACCWLLNNGIDPDRIRWVRPREMWFDDRTYFQPLDQVANAMGGIAIDTEAAAHATDLGNLFDRLEESGRLARIDPSTPATMYRGTMLSAGELEALRQIENVVRLGRVMKVEANRLVLEQGEIPTGPDVLHVDCTALGISNAPAKPIFDPGRITLQAVRHNSPTFNCALLGFVEARRDDDAEKNRLCPPNPYASSIDDWPRMMSRTWQTEQAWLSEPDLFGWATESRLNLIGAMPEHIAEGTTQAAVQKYLTHVGQAIENLNELPRTSSSEASSQTL